MVEILNAVAVCVVESVVRVRGLTSLSDVKICKKDEGGEIGGGCETGGEELAKEEEDAGAHFCVWEVYRAKDFSM